jgi:hypothetical protein
MNPNPVGAPEYTPMIPLNRLPGATVFRSLETDEADAVANALNGLNGVGAQFNETVRLHRWAQRFLAQGVDTSFDEDRFNQPGYQPVYGATPIPHTLPATPPNEAQLPLHAMYAQPPDRTVPNLERLLRNANTDAARMIRRVQERYTALGEALEEWGRSLDGPQTEADVVRRLQAGPDLAAQINYNAHVVYEVVDQALTMNEQRRQQAYPAPGIGLHQAPSPQFTPYPSPPQQATGAPMPRPNYAQPNRGRQHPESVPSDSWSHPELPNQRQRHPDDPRRTQSQLPMENPHQNEHGARFSFR